jgi:hypothetical protein
MIEDKPTIHDILVELGLDASVDGISKEMYLKAKESLLTLIRDAKPPENPHDPKSEAHFRHPTELPGCCQRVEGYNQALKAYEANLTKLFKGASDE